MIDDIDRCITYEEFRRFATIADGRNHDRHLGFQAVTSFFPSVLDVVNFTMPASTTLLQALEVLVKHSAIIDESVEITLRRDSSIVWLVGKGLVERPQPIVVDTAVAVTLRILRLLGAGRPINVHAARFSYHQPEDTGLHASVLGCTDMTFGQAEDAISFQAAHLEQQIPRPSSIVSAFLNELAQYQLDFLKQASSVNIKVREVITRGIGGSLPTLSVAATALHMPPRNAL